MAFSSFSKKKGGKFGLKSVCKKCDNIEHAIYYQTPNGRYSTYKSNARGRKLPFKLTLEEFVEYWNKPCTFCGQDIKGIGLDRIDSKEGYVKGNVTSCCFFCNKMKNIFKLDEFIEQCKKIAAFNKNKK